MKNAFRILAIGVVGLCVGMAQVVKAPIVKAPVVSPCGITVTPFDPYPCISRPAPVKPSTSAAPVVTAAPVNPASLLGNPARMYPASLPLNLDALIAVGLPPSAPYPFIAAAGPVNMAQWAANQQTWIDFQGVATYYANYAKANKATPPAQTLQNWANWSGTAFTYQGKVVAPNGKYSPF